MLPKRKYYFKFKSIRGLNKSGLNCKILQNKRLKVVVVIRENIKTMVTISYFQPFCIFTTVFYHLNLNTKT